MVKGICPFFPRFLFYSPSYLFSGSQLEPTGLKLAKTPGFLKPCHQWKLQRAWGRIHTTNNPARSWEARTNRQNEAEVSKSLQESENKQRTQSTSNIHVTLVTKRTKTERNEIHNSKIFSRNKIFKSIYWKNSTISRHPTEVREFED